LSRLANFYRPGKERKTFRAFAIYAINFLCSRLEPFKIKKQLMYFHVYGLIPVDNRINPIVNCILVARW